MPVLIPVLIMAQAHRRLGAIKEDSRNGSVIVS
jgi:hypothetical protein